MASGSNSTSALLKQNHRLNMNQQQAGPSRVGQSTQCIRLKSETGGAPTFPTERLSSFRLPRDLTLGGAGGAGTRGGQRANAAANKKVYTPNLNAIRNKNMDVKTSRDTTANPRGRGRGGPRAERGARGRGAGSNSRGALVASSGLFSEGAGEGGSRRSMSSRFSRSGEGNESTQLRKPTIIKKEKLDPLLEQKHIRDIYDLDCDPMEEDKLSDDGFSPINLSEVKNEMKLENRINGLEIKAEPGTDRREDYPKNLDEFFHRTNAQMFMLQLPDSLPGHGPIQEPAESAEFERPESPDPTSSFCTMGQLEEGLVGRLIRYKSGKTKLVLGDTRFDLSLGMEPGFLQEVISLTTNSTERSGNMINLGQIGAKFSAIPDWEHMLSTSSTSTTDS